MILNATEQPLQRAILSQRVKPRREGADVEAGTPDPCARN